MKLSSVLLVFIFCLQCTSVSAQKKIAVINTSDSLMHYYHLGVTMLTYRDTSICNFNSSAYIEMRLVERLSKKNTVSQISLLENLRSKNTRVSEIKRWIKSMTNEFDLVIIIRSGQSILPGSSLTVEGTGIYSYLNNYFAYSSVILDVYQTENGKRIPKNLDAAIDPQKIDRHLLKANGWEFNEQTCPYLADKIKILMEEKLDVFMTTRYFFMRYKMPFEV